MVEARSYSPMIGTMSAETETQRQSPDWRTTSATACSCAGFLKLLIRQTATESTPSSRKVSMAARTSSSATGSISLPSAPIRPRTGRRR